MQAFMKPVGKSLYALREKHPYKSYDRILEDC